MNGAADADKRARYCLRIFFSRAAAFLECVMPANRTKTRTNGNRSSTRGRDREFNSSPTVWPYRDSTLCWGKRYATRWNSCFGAERKSVAIVGLRKLISRIDFRPRFRWGTCNHASSIRWG